MPSPSIRPGARAGEKQGRPWRRATCALSRRRPRCASSANYAPGTNTVAFTLDAAGTGNITTPLDPSAQLTIEGVALSMVDTLDVTFEPIQGDPDRVTGVLTPAKTGGQPLA